MINGLRPPLLSQTLPIWDFLQAVTRQLSITIRGAWYTTWWAKLLWIVLLLGTVWYGWKYRKTLRNMFKKTKQDDLNVLIDDSETPADDEIEEAVLMDDEEK